MAELLIRIGDQDTNNPSAFKDGDIVSIYEDGHQWGIGESKQAWLAAGHTAASWPGIFLIVKIPTVTVDRARKALPVVTETLKKAVAIAGANVLAVAPLTPKDLTRDRISAPSYAKLGLDISTGVITITFAQIKNFVAAKS